MRVDFYLLQSPAPGAVWHLACRLIEKAYLRQHRVFIHCQNQKEAEHLDELLWTFKDESFIPHHLQGEGPEPPPPIQIGFEAVPHGWNDILMNLADPVPSFFTQFHRVIEIVPDSEEEKAISRHHYRLYRSHGCELQMHSIQPE